MDDSCAVCAETLEWVAYGPCSHRDVCSTCVVRLRFICNDRRCCICKAESNIVFVTKALGDYTRVISDFSLFPSELKEGRVGSYWYHEDTQSLFDDLEHYKMIKAMCRLSCSVCDKMDNHQNDGSKWRGRFKNIEQLKGHLHHQHRLLMCSLCLEGRKVFICEQKLYTRAQLKQHITSGDSEVDGTEDERGGFSGHPMCEFCRTPFYGDNELYTHMSTEHYTCHICQKQHPGQYEYYKNYDDLEVHFRREHFLCEDEVCLSKKFMVFQSEAEIKRHNTIEHGGRMSRSQRSAALQIPTSFRFRRNDENNHRGRGRGFGRGFGRESSSNQLARAIQASLETYSADPDPSSSSHAQASSGAHIGMLDIDPIVEPFDSLTVTDAERSSRYLQALSHNARNSQLEETAFPPLAPTNPIKTKQESEVIHNDYSMAAHLRRKSNRNVNISSSSSSSSVTQGWPIPSRGGPMASSVGSTMDGASGSSLSNSVREPSPSHSVYANKKSGSAGRISHSPSAPNLVSSEQLVDDFPPVSSAIQMPTKSNQKKNVLKVEDVQTANKSLVERIRSALNFDEDKYSLFKAISGEYRQGVMDAGTYLAHVQEFGLLHLVVELANLCPETDKQRELIDTYNVNFSSGNDKSKKKGKGKYAAAEGGRRLEDDIMETVRKLQSETRPSEEDVVEVLSKDGYRGGGPKGKSKQVIAEEVVGKGNNVSSSSSKQGKKSSKFHRARLGDGSVAALLDLRNSDRTDEEEAPEKNYLSEGSLPVRGVWKNGGGQKLVYKAVHK
ncbi:E3 ubiquitin-protein ligase HEL2-like [Impatiens glandulifera]|uniref:E3 ubiquitin-protein ligase HEL2-like n=1 Tax=Impatiens glandulifera TaxID=253017 RepID=UPI001FB17232|nr:E3 ubiquitin-protein ligase HEL2-like [Impatiens glandulifera]